MKIVGPSAKELATTLRITARARILVSELIQHKTPDPDNFISLCHYLDELPYHLPGTGDILQRIDDMEDTDWWDKDPESIEVTDDSDDSETTPVMLHDEPQTTS